MDAARQPLDATRQPFDAARQPFAAARQPFDATRQPLDAACHHFDVTSVAQKVFARTSHTGRHYPDPTLFYADTLIFC